MGLFDERIQHFQTSHHRSNLSRYQTLRSGQDPKILLITCSDSRILPDQLFQALPGEVFTIRNAGNIVPAFPGEGGENATIEYALTALDIDHIIICGHTHCGAMTGLLNPEALNEMPMIQKWLKNGPKIEHLDDINEVEKSKNKINQAICDNVKLQMEHLQSHPAYIKLCEDKQLTLHGWVYDFENGSVLSYHKETDSFDYLVKPYSYQKHKDSSFILNLMGVITCTVGLLMTLIAINTCITPFAIISLAVMGVGAGMFLLDQHMNEHDQVDYQIEAPSFPI